jgi:hypothetical protein
MLRRLGARSAEVTRLELRPGGSIFKVTPVFRWVGTFERRSGVPGAAARRFDFQSDPGAPAARHLRASKRRTWTAKPAILFLK